MLGFLGVFGRSPKLRRLDDALRAVDLHPNLVADSIKLVTVRQLEAELGDDPPLPAFAAAAELIAYCMVGPEAFEAANDGELMAAVEARIEAALTRGDSPDAQLLLLVLHAGVVQPVVIERFGLEAG
jgi:hypothetical protein